MLRQATLEDTKMVWVWRNDPVTRAMSFSDVAVPWADHEKWFERSLLSKTRHLLIYDEGQAMGMVRLDVQDQCRAEISINVAPEQRGRGYGPIMLRAAAEKAKQLGVRYLVARIKPENVASRSAFARAGYIEEQTAPGLVVMTYQVS